MRTDTSELSGRNPFRLLYVANVACLPQGTAIKALSACRLREIVLELLVRSARLGVNAKGLLETWHELARSDGMARKANESGARRTREQKKTIAFAAA